MTGTQYPEALVGWQFTPTLFATLGVAPALGRTFVADDGLPGRDNVVVLSDVVWRRRFGAATDVIGSVLQLDGRDYTVIGVMPPSFTHPYPGVQLWTPLAAVESLTDDRKQRALRVIARLQPGVTRERAEAELRAVGEQAALEFPDTPCRLDRRDSPAARLLHRRRRTSALDPAGDGDRPAAHRRRQRCQPRARSRERPGAGDRHSTGARRRAGSNCCDCMSSKDSCSQVWALSLDCSSRYGEPDFFRSYWRHNFVDSVLKAEPGCSIRGSC